MGLKGGILIDADSGPPRYVCTLMLCWYLSPTPNFFSNWLWPYCEVTLVLKTSPLRSRYAGSLIENYTAFEAMMKEEVLMSKNEDYYVYLYSMFCIRTKKVLLHTVQCRILAFLKRILQLTISAAQC